MKILCIKDLYKSTYLGLAFKSGNYYEIVSEDDEFIFIKDEKNYNFNFAKIANNTYYNLEEYMAY